MKNSPIASRSYCASDSATRFFLFHSIKKHFIKRVGNLLVVPLKFKPNKELKAKATVAIFEQELGIHKNTLMTQHGVF